MSQTKLTLLSSARAPFIDKTIPRSKAPLGRTLLRHRVLLFSKHDVGLLYLFEQLQLVMGCTVTVERQAEGVKRQWSLQLNQAEYEATLAERRYKAVDPDNRVVARTLERDWNDKLALLEDCRHRYNETLHSNKLELNEEDKKRVLSLIGDLPGLFWKETTTNAERKTLLRLMIREVVLSPVEIPERRMRIQVYWESGGGDRNNHAATDKADAANIAGRGDDGHTQ